MKAPPSDYHQGDEEIPSPCINTCRMEAGYCIGCYRTIDEIICWSGASDDERRAILAAAEVRRRLDPDAGLRTARQD